VKFVIFALIPLILSIGILPAISFGEILDSPRKQMQNGIAAKDVICKSDLTLIIRTSGDAVCVKPTTAEKLIERGWTEIKDTSSVQPIIKTGTYAGYCIGYCTKEFTINPEKIIFSQNGREFVSEEWTDLVEKTKETQLSQSEWDKLIDLIDFQKFNSLPDRIGCPGCADAPVEWIEISSGDTTKKIEFENGDAIPEIKNLIQALQEIRNTAESSINNFEECVSAGNPIMESYPRQCRTVDGQHFVENIDEPSCDPSYPDVCVTPYPVDLDCDEISYSNFRVTGSDPHGFDDDYDGIGCES
jgi:hypothetical protein